MSITSFMGGMTFVYMQVAFYGAMGARGLRNTARHPEIFAGLTAFVAVFLSNPRPDLPEPSGGSSGDERPAGICGLCRASLPPGFGLIISRQPLPLCRPLAHPCKAACTDWQCRTTFDWETRNSRRGVSIS